MTDYLCLHTGFHGDGVESCSYKVAHLQVVPIIDNPTVTDEFPEGAHLGKMMKEIRERRDQRNNFWEEKNKERWIKEEAKP